MATREQQIADLLIADAEFMALVPGGVYTDELIGIEGLHRGSEDTDAKDYSTTAAAFDEKGRLRTTVVVRQLGVVPYQNIRSPKDQLTATSQMVCLYFYQNRGSDEIEQAKLRSYYVLEGVRLTNPSSAPIMWQYETDYIYDVGPVANSKTLRQDWQIISTRKRSET